MVRCKRVQRITVTKAEIINARGFGASSEFLVASVEPLRQVSKGCGSCCRWYSRASNGCQVPKDLLGGLAEVFEEAWRRRDQVHFRGQLEIRQESAAFLLLGFNPARKNQAQALEPHSDQGNNAFQSCSDGCSLEPLRSPGGEIVIEGALRHPGGGQGWPASPTLMKFPCG